MAFNKTLGYDPDKDYSLALQDNSLTDAQRNQLQQERQKKITHMYGGTEPTMEGSDKTYSQTYGTGNQQTTGGQYASGSVGGVSWDGNVDYSALLGDLMNAGSTDVDWLQNLLSARTAKATYNPALSQYANDAFSQEVQAYIDALSQPEIELPTYDGGKWNSVLEQAANDLISMNYEDWTKGDQYKALAERYGLQGKMSMQDVLGQISSRTGGLASSYATTAAHQQYNDYMATLEQAAREMYSGERSDLLENAQFAQGMEQQEYNRYLDSLDQYWNQMEFGNQQTLQDQALAAEKAETLAAFGDFSGYKALGYSDAEIALMQAAYQSQQTADAAKGKGGGSYNNSGVDKENIKLMQDALGVTADGLWGSESQKAAKAAGWSTDAAEAWAAFGGGTGTDVTGSDYWLGNGSTAGGKTSLNFDEDEGIFVWNGQTFNDVESLLTAIEAAGLTDDEMATLKKKFGLFGFNLS